MRTRLLVRVVLIFAGMTSALQPAPVPAQQPDTPGHFDFYLMEIAWGPEFCAIRDVSKQCEPQQGFVLHGLWPQHHDGSYPVFCSDEPAPIDLSSSLDITPDLILLQHEWAKHGTCSAVGPENFFALQHRAFHALHVPRTFAHLGRQLDLPPIRILDDFYLANPKFPRGSLLLSCTGEKFLAVRACLSKDLQPIVCTGLSSCDASTLEIEPLSSGRRD